MTLLRTGVANCVAKSPLSELPFPSVRFAIFVFLLDLVAAADRESMVGEILAQDLVAGGVLAPRLQLQGRLIGLRRLRIALESGEDLALLPDQERRLGVADLQRLIHVLERLAQRLR